ncbi:MAG: hypothetical protein ACPGQV_20710 [Alphaproteobacteria bacterium]
MPRNWISATRKNLAINTIISWAIFRISISLGGCCGTDHRHLAEIAKAGQEKFKTAA